MVRQVFWRNRIIRLCALSPFHFCAWLVIPNHLTCCDTTSFLFWAGSAFTGWKSCWKSFKPSTTTTWDMSRCLSLPPIFASQSPLLWRKCFHFTTGWAVTSFWSLLCGATASARQLLIEPRWTEWREVVLLFKQGEQLHHAYMADLETGHLNRTDFIPTFKLGWNVCFASTSPVPFPCCLGWGILSTGVIKFSLQTFTSFVPILSPFSKKKKVIQKFSTYKCTCCIFHTYPMTESSVDLNDVVCGWCT